MRLSTMHTPTLREAPKDAEVISHQLLMRAGFIRRCAAGVYSFLPLAVRSLAKVSNIVREELNDAGAQEVLLPIAVPAELWQESGRWDQYGPELLRFKDRKQADFCIGPTHEEAVVDLVRTDVNSYKQLPLNLYQIQTKFRDEMRPRAGLMRGREFMMKDAYSFDASEEDAHLSYRKMYAAYERIFTRLGLDFRAVEADTGNIGGSLSHEFQVLADSGEDAIVSCSGCDYAANVEMVPLAYGEPARAPADAAAPQTIATPGCTTIDEVCAFLGSAADASIKAVLFNADDEPLIAFVRGDRELNEVKLKKAAGVEQLELADGEWFAKATGLIPGYIGPYDLKGVRYLVDGEIGALQGAVCGANQAGHHVTDVWPGRDFGDDVVWADLRTAIAGDPCPRCGEALRTFRGIEVGHVFFLGTKYSAKMSATFLDHNGKAKPFVMGCYGIGISRILSAAVEQNHDDRGIVWPTAIAPWEVVVVVVARDEDGIAAAETLYSELRAQGIEAVIDDRKQRPGVKFTDAELIGYPLQITAGRDAKDGTVEVKVRSVGERVDMPLAGLSDRVAKAVRAARAGAELAL